MPWVFVDDQLWRNAKITEASSDAVKTWLLTLSWANDEMTDGHVPANWAMMLASSTASPAKTITELVKRRLWHHADRPCKPCLALRKEKQVTDPIPDGGYYIHDYFVFQRARWSIMAERERMRALGSAGGRAKADRDRSGTPYRGAIAARHSAPVQRDAIAEPPETASDTVQRTAIARTPVPPVARDEITVPLRTNGPDAPAAPAPTGTGSSDPGARRGGHGMRSTGDILRGTR